MAQGEISHYCAAKFAVRGFTESLRIEMLAAGHPVRVTCVHPGGVRTGIATHAIVHARAAGVPVGPEELARERIYNEKLLKLGPDRAAETILDGVARGEARVLVGNDARIADLRQPVLFEQAVRWVYGKGYRTFIESTYDRAIAEHNQGFIPLG